MRIETLKKALPYVFKSQITPMLVGHHGVGKSQAIEQVCNELGYKYFNLRLGTQETGDLIGLADFLKDSSGQNVATKFMTPDWFTQLITYCEENPESGAVLFLDEINRARPDVLQAVFQLVLDKQLHHIALPKNCYVVGAMNPNTEDYVVTNLDDKALLDRFCHIKIKPTKSEWFDYARKKGFREEVISFLQQQPELLQDESLEEISLDYVKPSRRSWEAIHRLIEVKTPVDVLQELTFGLVGTKAGLAFIKSLSGTDKPITGEDIVKNFSKLKTKIKKYSKAETGGRIDILNNTCDSLLAYSQNRKDPYTKEEEGNIEEFLVTIPTDLSFKLCRELYYEEKNRALIDNSKKLKDILLNSRTKAGMAL